MKAIVISRLVVSDVPEDMTKLQIVNSMCQFLPYIEDAQHEGMKITADTIKIERILQDEKGKDD